MYVCPLLFWGLNALAGVSLAFGVWWPCLFVPLTWRRWPGGIPVLLLALLVTLWRFDTPPEEGEFRVHPTHISRGNGRFGQGWVLRGRLASYNVPVVLYLRGKRPVCDCDYLARGSLTYVRSGYRLKQRSLEPIEGTHSFAERRFQLKEAVRRHLSRRFHKKETAAFLAGLTTGDFSEPELLYNFGKLGLQHLMAISGFHFSLVALVLCFLLRSFCSPRWMSVSLIVLLSSYFLFIGAGPSVIRAWVMALVVLVGLLFERPVSGMNALGCALIVCLFWDPFVIFSVGFHYSFLCTAAILLFYRPIEKRLFSLFPLKEVAAMTAFNQLGYLVLSLFRKLSALTIAVNLVAFPLTLYIFHKFPLLSLFSNLIFPLLVSGALLLLPFAWGPLAWLEEALVGTTLNLAERIPLTLDFTIRVSNFPLWLLLGCFFALAAVLAFRYKLGNEQAYPRALPRWNRATRSRRRNLRGGQTACARPTERVV